MHSINCLIKTSSNSEKQRPPSRTVTSSSKTCVTLMSSGLMLLRQVLYMCGTDNGDRRRSMGLMARDGRYVTLRYELHCSRGGRGGFAALNRCANADVSRGKCLLSPVTGRAPGRERSPSHVSNEAIARAHTAVRNNKRNRLITYVCLMRMRRTNAISGSAWLMVTRCGDVI